MKAFKNLFSKSILWVKANKIVAISALGIILIIVLAISFLTGTEKRAIKKYISAINSCDSEKIVKTMDVKANRAWNASYYAVSYTTGENTNTIEKFNEALENISDEQINTYKEQLGNQYNKNDKGKNKIKLLKVVYATPAKDNKDLKKVVCKVRVTTKQDDNKQEESIWKKEKKYSQSAEMYVTFYLYKNKVIYSEV